MSTCLRVCLLTFLSLDRTENAPRQQHEHEPSKKRWGNRKTLGCITLPTVIELETNAYVSVQVCACLREPSKLQRWMERCDACFHYPPRLGSHRECFSASDKNLPQETGRPEALRRLPGQQQRPVDKIARCTHGFIRERRVVLADVATTPGRGARPSKREEAGSKSPASRTTTKK